METEVHAFLDNLETSESTRMAYANDLRVFLTFLDGFQEQTPAPEDINTQQVAAFLKAESKQGRRKSTLIRRLATLKYFRKYLVQEGLLPLNSFSVQDEEIQQVIEEIPHERSQKCLNQDQIDVLLAIIDSSPRPRALRDRAILMLLLETGLSVGDLTALDLNDLDLHTGRFHLNLIGKGDVWLELGQAKDAVKSYLEEGRPDLMLEPGEPALFISQMDGRLSRQGVWQILNHWGRKLHPPISLSPRILRHTAVLRMSKTGYSTAEIQLRLGHRNPISTRALIRRLQADCLDQL
ncbi:MAG: tyrosine-type recombinase/integrase [Chloroflexota bacterium]|nr:MAG: tyrosine-type recombinase/integrase [Chloroflexota bacterium]